MKLSNCLLLPNEKKDEGLALTRRLCAYLTEKDCRVFVTEPVSSHLSGESVAIYDEKQKPEIDLIIPIGGDGTIIGSVRQFNDASIPILGVNLGYLGFLAEVEPEKAEQAIDKVLAGDYRIEERVLLEGFIEKADGGAPISFSAMNDILINKHMMASLIEMDVSINGQLLDDWLGDGLIVCTPTGSTAYNLSAGGPIVAPSAKNLVITPLCVHTLNIRSIVTSENDTISVQIGPGKSNDILPSIISIDGQKHEWLMNGDIVHMRRSDTTIPIIKLDTYNFYQTLKRKMF